MLSNPTAGRRLTGRMIVLAGVAVALPLTATRAIEYVDVPMVSAAEPVAAPTAVAAVQVVQAAPAVQAVPAVQPVVQVSPVTQIHTPDISTNDGTIHINGHTKKWKDLTPAEKAEVRRSIADARAEIGKIDRGEIQREIREAMEEARDNQEDVRQDLADARAEVAEAMREIDANSAELRRAGQDPEKLKATVRASLKQVESIDVAAITRQALALVDPARIEAAIAQADAGIRKAEQELDRLEALDDSD